MGEHNRDRPVIDEAYRERLRNDPRVVRHVRSAIEPYVSKIRLTGPIDTNWLIGRREDDDVAPHLRGIDR